MAVDRESTLNLAQLITPSHDLADLDEAFEEEEIWQAIERLPARKAPSPDGFTAEFLRTPSSRISSLFCSSYMHCVEEAFVTSTRPYSRYCPSGRTHWASATTAPLA